MKIGCLCALMLALSCATVRDKVNSPSKYSDWKTSKYCNQSTLTIKNRKFTAPTPAAFPNLDRNLVCPLVLLIQSELINASAKALEEAQITYWAAYGTHLSLLRFNSLQPWDDDSDYGVVHEELVGKTAAIQASFRKNRLTFLTDGCFTGDYHCWVAFTYEGYRQAARSFFPEISNEDINFYFSQTPFKNGGTLDFFPHTKYQDSDGKNYIRPMGGWLKTYINGGGNPKGFAEQDMFPFLQGRINRTVLPYPKNYKEQFRVYYQDENAVDDWVMWSHHYSDRNRVKIEEAPEVRQYMENYIRFLFGDGQGQK